MVFRTFKWWYKLWTLGWNEFYWTINGKDYCVITTSSINDPIIANTTIVKDGGNYVYKGYKNNRLGNGWLNENGQVLIPTEQVKGYVTFSKDCYRYTE